MRHLLALLLVPAAIACLATPMARADTPSRWPMLHITKDKNPEGEKNNNGSVLVFKMLKGSPGTLAIYHKAPAFHDQGALAGLATTEPDEVIADLSKPVHVTYHQGSVWFIIHPAPNSAMRISVHGHIKGKTESVGSMGLSCDAKGKALFTEYEFNHAWVRVRMDEFADGLMGADSWSFKALPLTFNL